MGEMYDFIIEIEKSEIEPVELLRKDLKEAIRVGKEQGLGVPSFAKKLDDEDIVFMQALNGAGHFLGNETILCMTTTMIQMFPNMTAVNLVHHILNMANLIAEDKI